jgi:glycosyltransferase involved in cell wall biosynthesis
MKIALATDAWHPQVNGVVRTLAETVDEVRRRGFELCLVTPEDCLTIPMPGYASIRLAVAPRFRVRRTLASFAPDIVHIATEGPIGWSARAWCLATGTPFTTAFHTRFPEYAAVRTRLSAERFWPIMKRFHAPSRAVLVATESLAAELAGRGFDNVARWTRGIDQSSFRPQGSLHPAMRDLPKPVLLSVGRVAPEKNLEAFLDAKVPGTKVVVGDGPALEKLRSAYPRAVFLGKLTGEELAAAYRSADCFVFPSKTDTFGLVVIEALACGTPVAAYPVQGPIDILGPEGRGPAGSLSEPAGALGDDLDRTIVEALSVRRECAAVLGASFTWEHATDLFLKVLQEVHDASRAPMNPAHEPA